MRKMTYFSKTHKTFDPAKLEAAMPKADDFDTKAYNNYLTAEVLLPNMGFMTMEKVMGWKRDNDGDPMGNKTETLSSIPNPQYKVDFPDRATCDVLIANRIVESMIFLYNGE
jgi:hypothetical protein